MLNTAGSPPAGGVPISLDCLVLTPSGTPNAALAVAASRAGAIGVLDLSLARDAATAMSALQSLLASGRGRRGAALLALRPELAPEPSTDEVFEVIRRAADRLDFVMLDASSPSIGAQVLALRSFSLTVALVARSVAELDIASAQGADAVLAKGNEAGGTVEEESELILLQRFARLTTLPIWAYGGIGLHSAAAALVAGACGVVLDSQLLLARESPLPDPVRAFLESADGSETVCPGSDLGRPLRLFSRPGLRALVELRELEQQLLASPDLDSAAARSTWDHAVAERVDWTGTEGTVLALGQDLASAAPLARDFVTVGGILTAVRSAATRQCQAAAQDTVLSEGSSLARRLSTRYPLVQGPMTRVSDRAGFAAAVADAGGLPFLALSLLRGPEVAALLQETNELLGGRPWGAGILGFVPEELRAEQQAAVRAAAPPWALLAGGAPAQAHELEDQGIATFLHVPSPGLLEMYVQSGLRRFVFEGRECGGHVGPRSSLVLWDSAVRTLLSLLPPGRSGGDYEVLFAGGISDALSAGMASAVAAPLTARGVHFGVLVGTAYVFSPEAVSTGAITADFQRAALEGRSTTLLESGPGHLTRALPTPYAADFATQRRALVGQGLSSAELRERLEARNIGRLRVAAKGVDRLATPHGSGLSEVDRETQWSQGLYMIGQVVALHDGLRPMAELHASVSQGSADLLAALPLTALPAGRVPPDRPPAVAVVGMGTILPGAPDLRTFWANIMGKVDAVTEVPLDRWDWRRHFDSDRHTKDKIYGRWGGFVDEVEFDPVAFGMPPASVSSIEPFQLLGLLAARAALMDAGYLTRPFAREQTAVILGAGGGGADLVAGYMTRSMLPELFDEPEVVEALSRGLPEWTEDSFPGILMNVAAGRIANRLDLGGTNFTVDAACGSSLAAVVLAVRELQAGTAEMVIAGGVDAIQNPFSYLCFSKTQALSPTGRCRPFDIGADGIAISEGFAMVVLKRLMDAERDGDHVYAVIRGAGSSSDGRDRSLTAPRPEGQVRALRRAYTDAGFAPSTVGLIEAHGTGTVAGDRAEAQSLGAVFEESGAATQSCAVGSVKSMIGHTKATAGVAGLVKTVLALDAKVVPPTLGVTTPNPQADFANSPFYVSSEARPWMATDHPRRAGVSAFGFGGTNFHVVLEEHTNAYLPDRATSLDRWPAELFSWSAPDAAGLVAAVASLADTLDASARPELADLAYSLAVGDRGGPARLAVVASSIEDLIPRLRRAVGRLEAGATRVHDPDGLHLAIGAPVTAPALVFPGQGSQYVAMGADLATVFPLARRTIERADEVLSDVMPGRLSRRIFPPPTFTAEDAADRTRELTETTVAQPALGAVELAYAKVLESLGVRPSMTAGHSYGELVALAVAGRLSDDDLMRLSAARGRLIVEHATGEMGTMAAVDAPAGQLTELCLAQPDLVLANLNAPRQTVVSGPTAVVEAALDWCREHDVAARKIPVACAFHSPLVEPAQRALADVLASTDVTESAVPVWSNSTADTYPEAADDARSLLASHLTRPVNFVGEIEAMWAAGARVFVECGPRAVLTGLVGRILEGRDYVAVSVDRPGRPGLVSLLECLAAQRVEGVPVAIERLFTGRTVDELDPARLAVRSAAPSTSLFMVNGSRARPAAEAPRPRYAPVALPRPAAVDDGAMRPVSTPPVPTPSVATPSVATRPAEVAMSEIPIRPLNGTALPANGALVVTAPPPAPAAGIPEPDRAVEVMGRYQEVMQQFLEAQRSVMLAYLQRDGTARRATAGPAKAPPAAAPGPFALAAAPASPGLSTPPPSPPAPSPPAPSPPEPPPVNPSLVTSAPGTPAPAAPASVTPAPVTPALAAPLSAKADLSTEAVTAALLQVVSARTGYPSDMLGLDADLEADLGIDSIKRVEIAGQVMRVLPMPESAGREVEKVTASRTLRQVVGVLQELLSSAATTVPEPLPFAAESVGVGHTGRLVSQWSLAPDSHAPAGLAAGAVIIVAGSGPNPFADALALALRGRELPVEVLTQSLVELADPRAADALVATLRAQHGGVAALLHLGALSSSHQDVLSSMFALTQAAGAELARAASGGGAAVVAVRGTEHTKQSWPAGALAGFCRTLALEEPAIRVHTLDLDPDTTLDDRVAAVLTELDGSHEAVVVSAGARSQGRRAPESVPAPTLGREPRAVLDEHAVVLLTGGARGITAEVALALTEAYRPTLVLVGRTAPVDESADTAAVDDRAALRAALTRQLRLGATTATPAQVERALADLLACREVRTTLARLTAAGARVDYISCDVRDAHAFAAVVDGVYARHGRIDGVVHGAGVIEDKLIAAKTAVSFARVTDTKLTPARVLADRLRPETLQFLVFFSSVSARVGNRGQSDYAAANSALDALALALDARWPGHVVSIGWGPWAAGMVSPELGREFLSRGVPLLSPAEGRRLFIEELTLGRKGEVEVVLAALADERLAPSLQGTVARELRPSGPLLCVGTTRQPRQPGRADLTRAFDLSNDPCLDDHRIDGRPVVPFAYALELICEVAGELLAGAVVIGVEQLRLTTGIALADDRATVRVVAERHGDHDVDVTISSTENPVRQHYAARVWTGTQDGQRIDLPQPQALVGLSSEPAVRVAYEDLLFHGPKFQGIEELQLGRNGARAILRSVPPEALVSVTPGGSWLLDPLVLDCALQLQVIWARVNWDVTLLPTHLEGVDLLGTFTGVSQVRHEMRISATSANPLCHAQHWLHDAASGRPLAYLHGMTGAGSRALNGIVGQRRRVPAGTS